MVIDLNCDMGEGFLNDAALMPYISSANIACGFHAGDVHTMTATVQLAKQYGVAIGAHPGFADKVNFGRVELNLEPAEIYKLISKQLQQLQQICDEQGAELRHVKPHGALYNLAARDAAMAKSIALAIKHHNPLLILYGLSGSHLISEGKKEGLATLSEVFADRTYQDDGSLTPRSAPNALIHETRVSVKQVLQMVKEKKVTSTSGASVAIDAETICIHGDGAGAVDFAKTIHMALDNEGVLIKALSFKT